MNTLKMTTQERKDVFALASIMSLRLLGLFMVLPVLALYTHQLIGTTPVLMGLALGIYGLTQGLFQIPFGMLSDHIGRKPVIAAGLLIFIIGSLLCATTHNMCFFIFGRALQGAGAIGSTIIATIADVTREEQRTKAMAINGITIGFSFAVAMMVGPLLAQAFAVPGIFILASGLGVAGLWILSRVVPKLQKPEFHSDAELEVSQLTTILKNTQLARLNFGIFILHAIFAASFVVIPLDLQNTWGLTHAQQGWIFLPAFFLAFVLSFTFISIAEKKQQLRLFFLSHIVILCVAEIGLWYAHSLILSCVSLVLFFEAFSFLEACLPSWVSRTAPKARKGTALGIYSSSQYLGFFVGGLIGGYSYGAFSLTSVYGICVMAAGIWIGIAFGLKNPQYASSRR